MPIEQLKPEFIPLNEAAIRNDGTAQIKVIEPDIWGSSGFYSKEVLDRDIAAAFPKGTQMFWNHDTPAQEAARPEGDLSRLAAVTIDAPRFREGGAAGPGYYAPALIRSEYAPAIDEIGGHIGVSIRARGAAEMGEADGREGKIITQIADAEASPLNRIDFVTKPGAGGEIVQIFEAAPNAAPLQAPGETTPPNDPIEEIEPMTITQEQLEEATAAAAQAARDEADAAAMVHINALRNQVAAQAAAAQVSEALAGAKLPEPTAKRLTAVLTLAPPLTEAGTLDTEALKTAADTAIKEAQDEIAAITGQAQTGQIINEGARPVFQAGQTSIEDLEKELSESITAIQR